MEILIIFLLIILNGIFAMSEIAMVSAKKARLERAAKQGDRAAKKALELARNPSKFLSTVQIGITLIGILTGIYSGEKIEDDLEHFLEGYSLLAPHSETLAVTIIVIVLTFFSLVLGELVPKRIGLTMPESISKLLAYPMYFISIIAAPFIWLLTFTTELIIKLFNIKPSKESQVTEEEIKAIIQEGTETGVVQEREQDIVDNVFHFGDRKVKTLMTPRQDIEWLNITDTIEVIRHTIANSPHKSFPVSNDHLDSVAGILHSKELLNSILKNEAYNLQNILSPPIIFTENFSAYKALDKLRESKQRVALIVDEFGSIQGLLTMNDLIDALVGDFTKGLHDSQEIIPRDDGSFLVDASLPLPEFARYFEIDILNDESLSQINTLGGLLFHTLKKIPEIGYTTEWKNLRLEIVDMDGRRIDKVLVTRLSEEE
jgi:putative hemolysin